MINGQRRPTPRRPGDAPVMVSVPIAALLNASGIGVTGFIRLVRLGLLDTARRSDRFNCSGESERRTLRERYGRDIPDGLPDMEGVITGRRATGMFSLDVKTATFDGAIRWWEMAPRSAGDAQIRIEGAVLPESVRSMLPGRPLSDLVQHPLLYDERIVIRDVASYEPTTFRGQHTPGSIEAKLDVPRLQYRDHEGD